MSKPRLTPKKRTWEDGFKRKPKIDLSKQINIMGSIVVRDIKEGIDTGKDINKKKFKALSPSTVEAKRKKKSKFPTTILKDTGRMQKIYLKKRATSKKQEALVAMAEDRKEIGFRHNIGKNVPEREWFGVGSRLTKKLDKYIKLEMERLLKIK